MRVCSLYVACRQRVPSVKEWRLEIPRGDWRVAKRICENNCDIVCFTVAPGWPYGRSGAILFHVLITSCSAIGQELLVRFGGCPGEVGNPGFF